MAAAIAAAISLSYMRFPVVAAAAIPSLNASRLIRGSVLLPASWAARAGPLHASTGGLAPGGGAFVVAFGAGCLTLACEPAVPFLLAFTLWRCGRATPGGVPVAAVTVAVVLALRVRYLSGALPAPTWARVWVAGLARVAAIATVARVGGGSGGRGGGTPPSLCLSASI